MDFLLRRGKKREIEKLREKAFVKNGSILLESLVSWCDGRPAPFRNFSYQELQRATNNFDPTHLIKYLDLGWYRGFHEGRDISIKKYSGTLALENLNSAFTEVAVLAKVSAHRNFLKLIGCCLETPIPFLVTEFISSTTLSNRIISDRIIGEPIAWQRRLKIAREIAYAIAYLHTAFRRPIVHRFIKLSNIVFDKHDIPKLCCFEACILIPEGETGVEDVVVGTVGYLCPDYASNGWITEKNDAFSFGVILLQLLTGQPAFSLQPLLEGDNFLLNSVIKRKKDPVMIVDPAILAEEGGAVVMQQLEAVLQLALICADNDPEKRPTMVDVTKQLRQIERFVL